MASQGALLFRVRMEVLLRRALIDREAALAAMNRIAGQRLADNFRRSGEPLFHVSPAILSLFVFHCANGLPGQESVVLAGLLSARLDCLGLNAFQTSFDHHGYPQ